MNSGQKVQEQNNEKTIEFGRWLFAQTCTFVIGAAKMEDLPEAKQTEVAFTGRSNVGKSSLINGLLQRPRMVVSPEPGTTMDAVVNEWWWKNRFINS